jgi:iron(III) transport system substrate-binding protein
MYKTLAITLIGVLALLGGTGAQAQDAAARMEAARSFAMYQGADRQQKLIEAAKKEGELSVYHAYPRLSTMIEAFGKKYGIKVKTWRAGSEAILQRVATEARGGRFEVDIVQNNAPENEALHREKLVQEVRSPFLADLIPQAVPAHREWAGITLDVWTAAYNTDKVRKDELPKSYQDLLDPKWKGRLGIEAEDQAWYGTLLAALGEEQGAKLFSNLVTNNGISVRKGHSLLATLVASGEVPLALTIYNWSPGQLKANGNAPIEGLLLPPVIAQPSTIAMLKRAPHPATAVLFYDFMLSEGQKMLADNSYVVTSRKLPSPLGNVPLTYIDPSNALDLQDKWLKSFQETVVKRSR